MAKKLTEGEKRCLEDYNAYKKEILNLEKI